MNMVTCGIVRRTLLGVIKDLNAEQACLKVCRTMQTNFGVPQAALAQSSQAQLAL